MPPWKMRSEFEGHIPYLWGLGSDFCLRRMCPVKCRGRIQERLISLWANSTVVKPEFINLILVSEFLSSIRIRV